MVKLSAIANAVGGQLQGDGDLQINSLRALDSAGDDAITFCADKNYARLKDCKAAAVILTAAHAKLFGGNKIIVADPYLAYAHASALFAEPHGVGIHPTAVIAATAVVHKSVSVGAHCFIGEDCVIGENCVIDSGVQIYRRTRIGKNCRISSGVVLGASGFGFAKARDAWVRIEQLGGVVIGDDVDIGANTTIDRGALEDTVIGSGVKLDNQIQIAHNVVIGAHTIMAGCTAVAGSTTIGANCKFGGRASVLGHLQIADEVVVTANSLVAKSISKAGVYGATLPAQPITKWGKILKKLYRME